MSEGSAILPAWPKYLMFTAIAGFAASMAAAVIGHFAGTPSFHVALGSLFLSFATLKFCVGMQSVYRLRAIAAGVPDSRDANAVQVSWPAVLYKFAACAMSVFAGIYVLTVGAAKVDRIFGG